MNRDEAVTRLHANYSTFVALCAEAEQAWRRNHAQEALARAQIAADFAWHSHTGAFTSSTLEELVREIGEGLDVSKSAHSSHLRTKPVPGGVVHVITTASGIGGHSRAVWRWIEHDSERRHSVVLTRQAGSAVPAPLARAVERARGVTIHLDRSPGGLRERAKRLRLSCQAAEFVVAHTHPYDVTPGVAFAGEALPAPFVFFNHADHVFWLGTGASTLVASIRDVGCELALSRRGIPEQRSALLPIPLADRSARRVSKREAKLRLGVAEDAVVLLSAASEYKYASGERPHLTELVEPVLRNHPNAVFLAAGPSDRGAWGRARRRTSGQARPLGPQTSMASFYDAADVYLDSWPFSSLTSMLEAAAHGLPVLAFGAGARDDPVFGPDDPAVNRYALFADDDREYQSLLEEVISDSELRAERGEKARGVVAAVHSGANWRRSLGHVYERAQDLGATQIPLSDVRPQVADLDVGLIRLHEAARIAKDPDGAAFDHYRLLPLRRRLAFWRRRMRGRHRLWRALAPEAIGSGLEKRLRGVVRAR
jgi:hypothetical protein